MADPTTRGVHLLNVANYKSCCGGVRAEKLKLDPGETAEVEVTLRLDGRFGDVVNETEVVTDLPSDQNIMLRTSATSVPFPRVESTSRPDEAVLAGSKTASIAEFRVFSAGDDAEAPIDLDRVELVSTIPVEWIDSKRNEPAEDGVESRSRSFRATIDAAGAPGGRRAEVVMRMGAGDLLRHVVAWTVVAPVAVAPEMIVLKTDGRDARIVLKSQDRRPFQVTRVESDAPGIRGRAAASEPAPTQIVEVQGAPKSGTGRGDVSVFTDHPSAGEIEVPFIVLD